VGAGLRQLDERELEPRPGLRTFAPPALPAIGTAPLAGIRPTGALSDMLPRVALGQPLGMTALDQLAFGNAHELLWHRRAAFVTPAIRFGPRL